ncbi:aldehyde dehydrogenase family protein [Streptomyces canus]
MSATEAEAPTSGTVRTSDLLIAGEHVAARDGRYFRTTEALTGEPIARVAAASGEDVNLALEATAAALPQWSGLPPAARWSFWNVRPSCSASAPTTSSPR